MTLGYIAKIETLAATFVGVGSTQKKATENLMRSIVGYRKRFGAASVTFEALKGHLRVEKIEEGASYAYGGLEPVRVR